MSDFEVILGALASLDPDTRAEVIETMLLLRAMPRPVAVRVLAEANRRALLTPVSVLVNPL